MRKNHFDFGTWCLVVVASIALCGTFLGVVAWMAQIDEFRSAVSAEHKNMLLMGQVFGAIAVFASTRNVFVDAKGPIWVSLSCLSRSHLLSVACGFFIVLMIVVEFHFMMSKAMMHSASCLTVFAWALSALLVEQEERKLWEGSHER